MNATIHEILEFVKENDVKFIRLGFCDLFGFQKNIAIMASELQSAFENGVSFYAHAIRGFSERQSDLVLFPDPATLAMLPWRPGSGRVARFYCDIKNPDGSAFACDGRNLLRQVAERARKNGCACEISVECEFYLFKTNDEGEPTSITLDKGGYLDLSPLDKGEDIRRELCLTLEEIGIKPENSHHEQGPGQNKIAFKFDIPLSSADNLQTFKTVVKAIAARNGLFASFMPRPIPDAPGSGLYFNLSAEEDFIAGILAKIPEITLFLNPLPNSYERLKKLKTPQYASRPRQLRSPDPSLNPYLAFALIIAAGLSKTKSNNVALPESLEQAIAFAEQSDFVRDTLGNELLSKYIELKKAEAADFDAAEDRAKFYKERYFNVI